MIRGVAERAETQGADGYGGVVKPNGAFGDDTFSVSPRLSEHEGIRDDANQHAFQLLQVGACSDPLRHIYTLRAPSGTLVNAQEHGQQRPRPCTRGWGNR